MKKKYILSCILEVVYNAYIFNAQTQNIQLKMKGENAFIIKGIRRQRH